MRVRFVDDIRFSSYACDLIYSIESMFLDPSIIYDPKQTPFRASKTSRGYLLNLKTNDSQITIILLNSTMPNGDQVWYVNKELLSRELIDDEDGDFSTLIVNSWTKNRITENILDALRFKISSVTYTGKQPSSPSRARYFRSFSLTNFKAFEKEQQITIRPLTLIFGPNSGGKSSIIQGLIFANEVFRTGNLNASITQLGGSSIDLGGFRQYIHKRQPYRIFELSICIAGDPERPEGPGDPDLDRVSIRLAIGIPFNYNGKPSQNAIPTVSSLSVEGEGKMFFRIKSLPDGELFFDEIDLDNIIELDNICFHSKKEIDDILREIENEDRVKIAIQILRKLMISYTRVDGDGLIPKKIWSNLRVEDEKFQSLVRGMFKLGEMDARLQSQHYLVGTLSRLYDSLMEIYEDLIYRIEYFLDQIEIHLQEHLDRLQYLGPLRSYPSRDLASKENLDANWFAGGGYAWDVVRKDADVQEKVNAWLGDSDKLRTPYEFKTRDFQPTDKVKSNDTVQKLSLIDKRSDTAVTHRDVGIGISQVLPVLVSAYASREKIIAMEQPEIHLHPALQAELADVFIESAIGRNQNTFVLETHSEHLLLRMMRRMRETANGTQENPDLCLTPKDIVVLYVEPVGSESIVREMPLNEKGELIKAWPGGFFEEGFREVF